MPSTYSVIVFPSYVNAKYFHVFNGIVVNDELSNLFVPSPPSILFAEPPCKQNPCDVDPFPNQNTGWQDWEVVNLTQQDILNILLPSKFISFDVILEELNTVQLLYLGVSLFKVNVPVTVPLCW